MQFLIIALDIDDDEAVSDRRLQMAEAHNALSDEAARQAERLLNIDILDSTDNVRGNAMIVDFPSLEAVDAWIAKEPYITGRVWSKVEVYPCRAGADL
jgi:uncharacterized protein YciI